MSENEPNEYEILMSPTISNRLDSLNNKYNKLVDNISKISNYLEENRSIYLNVMEQIKEVSKKNCQIFSQETL